MDFYNNEQIREVLKGFMLHNELVGMEVILSERFKDISIRVCGKGRYRSGFEVWKSLSDYLKCEVDENIIDIRGHRNGIQRRKKNM